MSFIRYSGEFLLDATTNLDNLYISEYMPSMPDVVNKVYIYGLFLCAQTESTDNAMSAMSARLALDESTIEDAFTYLQALGLVQIVRKTPFEVRYVPVKLAGTVKKYKPEKYADFNAQMQEILFARMITPNEYNEYYELLERLHMEPQALVMIAKYATTLKTASVGYAYINTIARNWAAEGILTAEQVERKLLDYDMVTVDLAQVFKALAIKRAPDFEDRQLYLKWTKGLEFTLDIICVVARKCKKGGTRALDAKLTKYYEAKLSTASDITAYEANKDNLYTLAKAINRAIGVYYEQLDNVIDTYTTVWLNLGFDEDALLFIANACFRRGIRTLDGVNEQVQKFYRQGLVTSAAIASHLDRMGSTDGLIREILSACGVESNVTTRMRDSYRTWTYSWGFSHDVALYAASLSKNAAQPLPYINKILSDWHAKGVATVEDAKNASAQSVTSGNQTDTTNRAFKNTVKADDQLIFTHNYTDDQLNSLIDDLDNVDF